MVGYAGEATVQTDPKTGKKLNKGWWPEPWKPGKQIFTEKNAYACISSSIKTKNEKGQERYWRGEASFGHGLALMVDDIGDGKGSKGGLTVDEMKAKLPPTVVIETSPGNYQLWYFMAEPIDNLRLFKGFLTSFVMSVLKDRGGDHTIRDVSRYGRMPIGINNKRLPDGSLKYGSEFRIKLEHVDYAARYSIEDMEKAFGFKTVVPVQREPDESMLIDRDINEYLLAYAARIVSAAKMGEGAGGRATMNMSGKYRIQCPWGDSHGNSDRGGAYFRGYVAGADVEYVFGCSHDTCKKAGRKWGDFVDATVMPFIYKDLQSANDDYEQYERECFKR